MLLGPALPDGYLEGCARARRWLLHSAETKRECVADVPGACRAYAHRAQTITAPAYAPREVCDMRDVCVCVRV